jgi:hypothetical protein
MQHPSLPKPYPDLQSIPITLHHYLQVESLFSELDPEQANGPHIVALCVQVHSLHKIER